MYKERNRDVPSLAAIHPKVKELERLFYPRSIATVGVSNSTSNAVREIFFNPLLDSGFEGQVYPIHPKGGEVQGLKVYPSIKDVPGPLDYVVVGIRAELGPQLVKDCGVKGVSTVMFYTAGFGESGTARGIELEADLTRAAKECGVRIIGPNCVGVYCPESRIHFWSGFPREPGPVGYICQSGGNTIELIRLASPRGVRFSKVISFGNACDLNECDFLEYLTHDPKTEIIALYLEGVKDGQRFVRLLSEAARRKPVILLKGGVTEAGIKATSSHTGSLAGSGLTWEVLCKQLGVIQVHSLDELSDMLVTLLFMPVPPGRRVAILSSGGGGACVLATDDCERCGLVVPALSSETTRDLLHVGDEVGTSVRNPVDFSSAMVNSTSVVETTRIISESAEVDFLLTHVRAAGFYLVTSGIRFLYQAAAQSIIEASSVSSKPLAVVIETDLTQEAAQVSFAVMEQCVSRGFATYPSVPRAGHAISRFINYHDDMKRRVCLLEDCAAA